MNSKASKSTVVTARQIKVMLAQFKHAVKESNTFIKFAIIDETDVYKWVILIHSMPGDDDEYAGGEYLCLMNAPSDFPFKPPEFYFLTPTGVYDINKKVCISIGEYHSSDYRAGLGMSGFAIQLVSGLIGWRSLGGGINIIKTSAEEKKRLAAASVAYNMANHADLLEKINASYLSYSSAWPVQISAEATTNATSATTTDATTNATTQ